MKRIKKTTTKYFCCYTYFAKMERNKMVYTFNDVYNKDIIVTGMEVNGIPFKRFNNKSHFEIISNNIKIIKLMLPLSGNNIKLTTPIVLNNNFTLKLKLYKDIRIATNSIQITLFAYFYKTGIK